MAAIRSTPTTGPDPGLPLLQPGDHLDRATFHARYSQMPEDVRAELIEGIVYLPSPVRAAHGRVHAEAVGWLGAYKEATPCISILNSPTVFLGDRSEPQPDVCLTLAPERGGQTREEQFIIGAPELVVEVAYSSESYDLHSKKRDYERAGVTEYVVVLLREQRVVWFNRREDRFDEMAPAEDGLFRSQTLPGLWLDPAALLRLDSAAVRQAVERGLATPEHSAFARA